MDRQDRQQQQQAPRVACRLLGRCLGLLCPGALRVARREAGEHIAALLRGLELTPQVCVLQCHIDSHIPKGAGMGAGASYTKVLSSGSAVTSVRAFEPGHAQSNLSLC
jgi:hypothetical protein